MPETPKKHIALISTGGTIEKTYDELRGILENRVSVLDVMLDSLELDGVWIQRIALMNKDSLEMQEEDHLRIAETAERYSASHDGVVITHGTDRLAATGEEILRRLTDSGAMRVPVVLIGAMLPFVMRTSDAMQNLTEALLAVQLLPAGVYCVMHNKVLPFPGVHKDPNRNTFVRK